MVGAKYSAVRLWTYELFAPKLGGRLGLWTDWFIIGLIAVNVVAVMLETVEWIDAAYGTQLYWFEVFSVAIFTVEYLGRIWSAIDDPDYTGIISGRVKFATRPLQIVDFLAILPFYLMLAGVQLDLRFLRVLRMVRLIRLLKLARYSKAMQGFGIVFKKKKEDLLLAFFANMMLLILTASIMFLVEHQAQPDVFTSIPATFYWAFITLTTVGYGDITPITPVGQILTGFIALLGIGLFALPASILASGFLEENKQEAQSQQAEWEYCPHCGEELK